MNKLYEMPEHKGIKIYLEDRVVIFDHLDGIYSYCYMEKDKTKIIHIRATVELEKYKDGYKIKEEK